MVLEEWLASLEAERGLGVGIPLEKMLQMNVGASYKAALALNITKLLRHHPHRL